MAGAGKRGVIGIAVVAKVDKFARDMKKAAGYVGKFGTAVGRMAKKVATFGAITLAAATAGLAYWVKKTAGAIDATAKLSDRIGIAIEDLQALRHAARITGAGTESLDKALQFLAKSLGEAQTGVGEAKDALKLMNLSVDDFLGKSPFEQILKIADAFQMLSNQEQKAFVASRLFGRAGVSLVNLLDRGRGGILKLREEAIKLGIAFTRPAASSVEKMNDALNNVKEALQGVVNTITIAISGPVANAANAFVDWAKSGEGLSSRLMAVFEDIAVGFRRFVNSIRNDVRTLQMGLWTFTHAFGMPEEFPTNPEEGVKKLRELFASFRRGPAGAPRLGGFTADELRAAMLGPGGPLTSADFGMVGGARTAFRLEMPQVDAGRFVEHPGRGAWEEQQLRRAAFAEGYGGRTAGIVTTHISDAITRGIFEGFNGDAGREILRSFGQSITQTVMDALLEAVIATPIKNMASQLFSSLANSAASSV